MADFKKYIPLILAGGVVAYLLLREEEEEEVPVAPPRPPPEPVYAVDPYGVRRLLWEYRPKEVLVAEPVAPPPPPTVAFTSIDTSVLSRSLERFQQQQAKVRLQQGLTMYDIVGSDQIDGSEVMELIEQKQNVAVFTMPLGLPKYKSIPLKLLEEEPASVTGRMHIYIDTWESFHYFSDLIFYIFMMTYPVGTEAEQAKKFNNARPLIQWFNYHKFHLKGEAAGGIVQATVKRQMNNFMCSYDRRTASQGYWKYDAKYPGLGFVWDPKEAVFKHCTTGETRGLPDSIVKAKYDILVTDGLQLMIEHAAVKFANMAFAMSMSPELGKILGDHVWKTVGGAVTLAAMGAAAAGLLGTAAATAAAGPVGWIAAALAAIGATILAIFSWGEMIGRNRRVRDDVADFVNTALREYFRRGTIKETFSGYRLKLLLPQGVGTQSNAPWEDLSDSLWPNYILNSSWAPEAVPQLPFYYLNLNFDVLCSVTVPWNEYLVLEPIKKSGVTIDYKQKIVKFEDAETGINWGTRKVV